MQVLDGVAISCAIAASTNKKARSIHYWYSDEFMKVNRHFARLEVLEAYPAVPYLNR